MGYDGNEKSLLGRLAKAQEKFADGVYRRMDQNDQAAQARLDGTMGNMSLQPQADGSSQKSRHSSSSRLDDPGKAPSHQQPQDQEPPTYYDESPRPFQPQVRGPQKLRRKSIDKTGLSNPSAGPSIASSSSAAPAQYFATNFASLSLHRWDRLRLMDFPTEIITLVRAALLRSWPAGIQDEGVYFGSLEFKLYGNPWSAPEKRHGNASRLTRHILEVLYNAGWVLALTTDTNSRKADTDTLVFRHQSPTPARREWMGIDFARGDHIIITDAPQNLLDAVYAELQPAIQEFVSRERPGLWEVKLYGYPWSSSGGDAMTARRIVLQLFATLERFGFTVYASIDQDATGSENKSGTDTWHCSRPLGWEPGAPVYHA